MKLSSGELKKKIQELLPNAGKIKRISKERDDHSGYITRTFETESEDFPEIIVNSNITDQYLLSIGEETGWWRTLFSANETELYLSLPDREKLEMRDRLSVVIFQYESKNSPEHKQVIIEVEHDKGFALDGNTFDLAPLEEIELFKELERHESYAEYCISNTWDNSLADSFRTEGDLDIYKVANYIQQSGIKVRDKSTAESERIDSSRIFVYYYKADTEKHRERQLKKIKNNS